MGATDNDRQETPIDMGDADPVLIQSLDTISFVRPTHILASRSRPSFSLARSRVSGLDARFLIVLALTTIYLAVEVIVGFYCKSLALVADAMHMLSDVIAMGIGLYAMRMMRRPANERSTFGWTRCEVVGGLINSTFMMSICFSICLDALQSIVKNEAPVLEDVDVVLYVSIGGLFLNLFGFLLLGSGDTSSSESGKAESALENQNIQGVLLHVAADGLGSVGVIISSLIIKWCTFQGRFLADPICSILIVLILAIATVPLMRSSIQVLLQQTPPGISVQDIIVRLLDRNDVVGVYNFHLWTLNRDNIIASMHVILTEAADIPTIMSHYTSVMKSVGVSSVTIHPEREGLSLSPMTSLGS